MDLGVTDDFEQPRQENLSVAPLRTPEDRCLWCPAPAHLETGMLDGTTPDFCAAAHRRAEELRASVTGSSG